MNTNSGMKLPSKCRINIVAGFTAGALSLGGAVSAGAATVSINLAGWSTVGTWDNPGNSRTILDLGVGTLVTGYDFVNVSFSAVTPSWGSEMTISASTSDLVTGYLDWKPIIVDAEGSFGPVSGSWNGGTGGPGPFGAGGAFTLDDGNLLVQIYEGFDDNDPGPDATIASGTLIISYTPAVPEPGAGLMMTMLGALVLGSVRRRHAGVK